MYKRVRVCVNVERAHVTSACCYLEITARKCRSFEEEEKGIEFGASVKKSYLLRFVAFLFLLFGKWSSFRGGFLGLGRWLIFAARVRGKEEKNKKICASASSKHHMCSARVVLYACNIHT
jgi:hypothetical protein